MGANMSKRPSHFDKLSEEEKRSYPYNVFFSLFPDFCGDKFDPVYIKNLNTILRIYQANLGFQVLEDMGKYCLTFAEIESKHYLTAAQIPQERFKALKIIRDNKDVIFNGFGHSKLRNRCIDRLCKEITISRYAASGLVDSGLYSISDIKKVKDGKTLIKILSKEMESERVGKVLEETLTTMNKLGYDTERFGYTGTRKHIVEPKKELIAVEMSSMAKSYSNLKTISGYKYGGFSETTFKIECPVCESYFRIHLVGHVDNDGRLKIERTTINKNAVWYCPECKTPIKVDKIDTFLKNYMEKDS